MSVLINASTSGGVGITSDNSGIIQFQSNGANTVTINTSGNVGIGTTPSAWASASKAIQFAYGGGVSSATGGDFNLHSNAYNSSSGVWTYHTSGLGASRYVSDFGNHSFLSAGSGTAGNAITWTLGLKIDSSGNALIGVTSATANGGILQLSGGITFPATQVAASNVNTLDDYEEGTWTPTAEGATTAGTATYSVQVGRYTKIGNRVYFNLYIVYTGGNGTGNMQIGGLPFTSNSTTNNLSAGSLGMSNIALTASNVIFCYIGNNTTKIAVSQYPVGGGAASGVAYDGAGEFIISGHYEV